MKQFKRILALVMALAMVLALAACGGGSAPAETKAPEEAPAETKAPEASAGEPRHITIGLWWDIYYDSTHEAIEDDPAYAGNVADQMRWDVVEAIEKKYNVTFEYVNLTYTGITESINTSILAGTPECDIYMCDLTMGIPAEHTFERTSIDIAL